jgi:hypothetical protein
MSLQVGELNLINCQYDCEAEYEEIGKFGFLETQTTSTTTEETLYVDGDMEGSGDANEPSLEVSPEDEEDVNIIRTFYRLILDFHTVLFLFSD